MKNEKTERFMGRLSGVGLIIVILTSGMFVQQAGAQQAGGIVYAAPTGPTSNGVFVATLDGNQAYKVNVPLLTICCEIAVSPDGHWIAAAGQTLQDQSNDASNIYVFSPTGAGFSPITSFTTLQHQGYIAIPDAFAFSPDSSNIAFTVLFYTPSGWTGPPPNITGEALMTCPVKSPVQVVGVGSVQQSSWDGDGVAWAPDGQHVVTPVAGASQPIDPTTGIPLMVTSLYSVPAVTNGINQAVELTTPMPGTITDSPSQVLPVYSPDGTTIAFVVWHDDLNAAIINGPGFGNIKSSSIYLVSAAGGTPTLVTTVPDVLITSVSWIQDPPSTGKLLFSEAEPSNLTPMGIWEVNTDGSGLQEVIKGSGFGVWSSSIPLSPETTPTPTATPTSTPTPTPLPTAVPTPTSTPAPTGAAPYTYITNSGSNTISVIDTTTNSVTATVSVGNYPEGIAVSPAGTKVYVANTNDNTVSVIEAATNAITSTVPVGSMSGIQSAVGVAVNPAGTKVYVANSGSNTVFQ